MAATEESMDGSYPVERKLWWLIVGRLSAALVLLLASTAWIRSTGQQTWDRVFPLFALVVFLTIAYTLAHRLSKRLLLQARIQFTLDVFLVTWLVWTSDVIHSPYTAIYIVIIAAASVFLGPRDAAVTSVGCAIMFTGCALAAISGFGSHPAKEMIEGSLSQAIQTVGLFDIAFFVVGLLSARLAQNQSRSDVRLIAATQSLANLRELHERIVESIRSGVVTTDLQGRIYTFNSAAEEITGYNKKDVRGQDASIFFGEMGRHISTSVHASEIGKTSPRF